MARVLVTGASGFIGTHLVEALVARGDQVTCLVRKTSPVDRLRRFGVKLVCGDVTEPDSLSEPMAGSQVVYHVAGCTKAFRAEQLFSVNEEGGRNVAEACARQPTAPVLVWVSSLAAAGPAPNSRPRTERDEPVQVSHYGRSKRAGERAAEEYAGRVPISIVRPAMVVGEADTQSLAIFVPIARVGMHVVPGLGRGRFSLIHVADLVHLLILVAGRGARLKPVGEDRGAAEGYYLAACPEQPTYAELGRMIGTALGRRRVLVVPTFPQAVWPVAVTAETIARVCRRPFTFNLDKAREVRAGSWVCSTQRAADELGFSVGAPLAERLRQTAQWYRENGWL